MWVQYLGQEDTLEEEMAALSGILAWEIPWTEEPGGLQFMGSQRLGHDWETEHTRTSHGSSDSVQSSPSVVSDSVTPWTAARQASLSITNSQSLLTLMSFESVVPSNHLIL